MPRFVLGVIVGIVIAAAAAHAEGADAMVVNYRTAPPSPREVVADAATQAGVSAALMLAIADCESGLSATAMNPSGARGAFQLMPGGELRGFYARGFTDWTSIEQQAEYVAQRLAEDPSAGPWRASQACWAGRR